MKKLDMRDQMLAMIRSYEFSYGPFEDWPGEEEVLARFEREHAHELAEKIRKELPETTKESVGFWTIRTVPTARQAADLIDPEVK